MKRPDEDCNTRNGMNGSTSPKAGCQPSPCDDRFRSHLGRVTNQAHISTAYGPSALVRQHRAPLAESEIQGEKEGAKDITSSGLETAPMITDLSRASSESPPGRSDGGREANREKGGRLSLRWFMRPLDGQMSRPSEAGLQTKCSACCSDEPDATNVW